MKILYLWEVRLTVKPWNVTRKIVTEEKKVEAVTAVLREEFLKKHFAILKIEYLGEVYAREQRP